MLTDAAAWQINICKIKGLSISAHFVLCLFLSWAAFESLSAPAPISGELAFAAVLILSVLLHEAAHLGTARLFGITASRLVLLPCGADAGYARRLPRAKALIVLLAGPACSALAALCASGFHPELARFTFSPGSDLLNRAFSFNVVLAVCNVLPLPGCDGQAALQVLLSSASQWAASLLRRSEQLFPAAAAAAGIWTEDWLITGVAAALLAAILVRQLNDKHAALADELLCKEALLPLEALTTLPHGITVRQSIDVMLHSAQDFFPVMLPQRHALGFIERADLLYHAVHEADAYVSELAVRDVPRLSSETPLAHAFQAMHDYGCRIVLIEDEGGALKGALTAATGIDLLRVRQADAWRRSEVALLDDEA